MKTLLKIASNPSLIYYYGQKGIRIPSIRRILGKLESWISPSLPASSATESDTKALSLLRTDGIAYLADLHLCQSTLNEIYAHYEGKPVIDLYSGQFLNGLEGLENKYNKVQYQLVDTLTCTPLLNFANHPTILATVAQYLGAKPSISAIQSWWTIGEHNQNGNIHYDDIYHRDVDDFRFVKLFVYLTDTSLTTGAHSYIKGSHRSDLLTRRGPISDEEAKTNFDTTDFETVTGFAGTAFLEDTWGIHRPLLAIEGRRLIFSVIYSLSIHAPDRPSKPLIKLPDGLDPYVNRAFCF